MKHIGRVDHFQYHNDNVKNVTGLITQDITNGSELLHVIHVHGVMCLQGNYNFETVHDGTVPWLLIYGDFL